MIEEDEHENQLDDGSSDYIHRPEDPYPTLQSTRRNIHLMSDEFLEEDHDEQTSTVINDEMDLYLKTIPPYKHQAYLIEEILQSVCKKFVHAQEQFEQRFLSFINEQRCNDQLREERIHKEQRQYQFEILQLILNQGSIDNTALE